MIGPSQRISLRRITAGVLAMGWAVAWATVDTIRMAEPDLIALPWIQIVVGAAIASWGGATATLGRYLAASYDARPFRWRVETARDACVSVTVGGGGYFGGAWYGMPPMLLGLVLLLAGYLGVRILSGAADRLLGMIGKI